MSRQRRQVGIVAREPRRRRLRFIAVSLSVKDRSLLPKSPLNREHSQWHGRVGDRGWICIRNAEPNLSALTASRMEWSV